MRKVFFVFFLILIHTTLILPSGSYADEDIICTICGRKIDSKYFIYNLPGGGKEFVCGRCEENASRCDLCTTPVGVGEKYRGYYLCKYCKDNAKFCYLCGQLITSRYVVSHDNYYCSECANSKPKCSMCGLFLNPPNDWDQKSKLLCKKCTQKAVYCSRCNKIILGAYSKYESTGKVVCDDCLKIAPKCDRCKTALLIDEGNKVRDKVICNKCFHDAENCYLCGNPIVGSTFSFKYAEGKFCEFCIKNRPGCDICGRPIGDKIFMFPDGRRLCDECHKEVVISLEEVSKIHKEVISFLEQDLKIKVQNMPKVYVVDSKTLQGFFGKQGTWSQTAELGAFRVYGKDMGIYVLEGLPKTLVYETLAHETAHVFQYERNPKLKKQKVIEGFAQWAAGKLLEKKGFYPELDKLRERTDIYGEGYREVLKWEFDHGAFYVIGRLKSE